MKYNDLVEIICSCKVIENFKGNQIQVKRSDSSLEDAYLRCSIRSCCLRLTSSILEQ